MSWPARYAPTTPAGPAPHNDASQPHGLPAPVPRLVPQRPGAGVRRGAPRAHHDDGPFTHGATPAPSPGRSARQSPWPCACAQHSSRTSAQHPRAGDLRKSPVASGKWDDPPDLLHRRQ